MNRGKPFTTGLAAGNLFTTAMRILGIDHGTKRVGLALSDESGTIAQPLLFLAAEPATKMLESLKSIADQHQVVEIVVGLPRNMNGTYGPAAEKAREFVAALQKVLTVPIHTW